MTLKLIRQELIEKLLLLPESGMGYQIVDIILKNGRIIQRVKISNAEIIYLPEEENISENDILEFLPSL